MLRLILSNLINDTEQRKEAMAMFEEPEWGHMSAERTAHTQIPPASIRIQSVKTRGLKNLPEAVKQIEEKDAYLIQRKQQSA